MMHRGMSIDPNRDGDGGADTGSADLYTLGCQWAAKMSRCRKDEGIPPRRFR